MLGKLRRTFLGTLTMHIFADDGDSFGTNGFLCLAGFIASDTAWDRFGDRWESRLQFHGINAMHTSDFLSGQGAYRSLAWSFDKRLNILSEFMDVIREEVGCGIACALNAGEYRTVLKESKKKLKPEEFLFRRLLGNSFKHMASIDAAEPLGIWLDDSEKTSSRFLSIWTRTKKNWQARKSMLGHIAFGDDQALLPLQAADVLANILVRSNVLGMDPWHGQSPFNRMFIDPKSKAVSQNIKAEFWEPKDMIRLKDVIVDLAKPQ